MPVHRWLPEDPTKTSLTTIPDHVAFYCLNFLADTERFNITETCHTFREAFIRLTTGKMSWRTHSIIIKLAYKGHRFPAVSFLRLNYDMVTFLSSLSEQRFPRLKRLELKGVKFDQIPVHHTLSNCRAFNCRWESGVFPFPNLRIFKVQGGQIKALPDLQHLEEFHVNPAALLLTNLHQRPLKKLKKLTLKNSENVTNKLFVEPMALICLDESAVPALEELHIQDPELCFLPAHSKLRTLSIDTKRKLDLSQLTQEKFPRFTSLRLVGTTFSSLFDLGMLPPNDNLTTLLVRHGSCLKGINRSNFPNLKMGNISTF